jgi:membrane dipeptidase
MGGSCIEGTKPRVESSNPQVAAILESSDVWEMTVPLLPLYWDIKVLERYKRAGYTFVSGTLQDWPPTFQGIKESVRSYKEMMKPHSWVSFISSLTEIERARKDGNLAVGLNSQEARIIGHDLSRINELYELGVRQMVLAYNVRNYVADGCAEMGDAGLSNFGRQVVREMNRVGMIVDCSHTGRRSSLEAIEVSDHPVIFSHSGVYSLFPHIRNVRDEQIRACAEAGGVVGVVGLGRFLGDPEASTATYFRHIDYIADLVGPEHVGIGTDLVPFYPLGEHKTIWSSPEGRGIMSWPDPSYGWPDPTGNELDIDECRIFQPEQLTGLVELMLDRAYTEEQITQILGGNFKRVYGAVTEAQ